MQSNSENSRMRTALVTGSAGFIGYHVCRRLLHDGFRVIGIDALMDYYDVALKQRREAMLLQPPAYSSVHTLIETPNVLMNLFAKQQPDVVIHLVAQAGVRYSIEKPTYANSFFIATAPSVVLQKP